MNEGALPELPGGWAWTRLGDIGIINPKHNGDNIGDDTEVTFLPMRCVEELTGLFDLSMTKRFSEVKKGYTPFINGDLIFAKITPCMENGKVAIVQGLKNGMGFGSTEFHVIRFPEFFPRKFFFYFLIREELRKDAQRNMTGSAGQLRVPANYIHQIPVPLPPLPEQRRIVAKLEELFTKLDAGVEALKKTQAQLKRYRSSVLKSACEGNLVPTEAELARAEGRAYEPADVLLARILKERRAAREKSGAKYKEPAAPDTSGLPILPRGWEWANVGQITEMIGSGITPLGGNKNYLSEGVLFIRSQNVQMMHLNLSDVAYVSQELHEQMSRTHVHFGDVLLNITGASIGRVAWFNLKETSANVNQHVCILRLVQKFPEWVTLFHASSFGQAQIMSKQSGATRQGLNYEQAKQLVIPLPPLAEQRRIVAEVERRLSVADGVERTVEQSLAQAQRLRQSVLKKAFEGRLVAQDANDEPASALLEKIRLQKQLEIKKGRSKR